MSLILKATFPAGRYHATPWGRHVNEGVAEWPPSPWRLLRALVAVWKRTLPELAVDDVQSAIGQLVEPPVFQLPPHRVAHTRHYMPWEKKGPQDRTLVFDTFVSLDRQADLLVGWPHADLSEKQRAVLNALLTNLTSLGRAESWVEMHSIDGDVEWNCKPSIFDANPVPVLCPDPATCFASDLYPVHDAKKLAQGKVKPGDWLFDCPRWHLCLDTETVHAERWPSVPGSKWVNYARPMEFRTAPRRNVRPSNRERPTVAQFLLDGPLLPRVTDTIQVAESFRRAAMSRFGWWCAKHPREAAQYRRTDQPNRFSSPILSGKNSDGSSLTGHGHAYFLPLPLQSDSRRIGSVFVLARDGFAPAEVAALAGLSWLDLKPRSKEGDLPAAAQPERHDLQVQLTTLGQTLAAGLPMFNMSDEWESVTPFLGHASIGEHRRLAYLRKGLRREWRRLVEQRPAEFAGVELLEICEVPCHQTDARNQPQAREFRRIRQKHGQRTDWRPAAMFRLRFSKPVPGPICLGYAAHFGMGLFASDVGS